MTDEKGTNEVDPVADLSDEELEEASGGHRQQQLLQHPWMPWVMWFWA